MSAGAPATIVLVDDHTLVRAGLRALIETIPDMQVVAEAGDGRSGLEAVRRHRPRILITDVTMGDMTGLQLTELVRAELPATRVIILSMFSTDEYVMRALTAGASAYLLKDAAPEELDIALKAVLDGKTYLSPGASTRLVERVTGAPAAGPLDALTARQREILRLLTQGTSSKEIAYRLGLSRKTVDAHRAHIMERLGIDDLAGLVRLAIREGLISPHD
jgi:DNA-binding NarL/FixJ family response regulator